MFHLDVAKVDRNVAHIAVAIHASRFPDICLQVFHLDVAYIFTHMKCFQVFFASI